MGRKRPDLISAVPPLFPVTVIDLLTGEIVPSEVLSDALHQLTGFVRDESERLWEQHKSSLNDVLDGIKASSPAEVGRQAGLVVDLTGLPREVKAKSRIERLVRYQVITSAKSYYESDVSTKQEPSFAPYLNLGAVDAQMAILEQEDNQLTLKVKLWDRELALKFTVPDFILSRNITKFTLPTVKLMGEDWGFIFNAEEAKGNPVINQHYVAGIDLGRVEPYTMVIMHVSSRKRVAQFTASPRIRVILSKRDRLNQELGELRTKSETYAALQLDNSVLERERVLTRTKRNLLNRELTWLIAKEIDTHVSYYKPRYVAMENLSWINAKHGMSRWSHSKDQVAIHHKLTRQGIPTKKVSARNTSQECSKCSAQIKHIPGKRLIVCPSCVMVLDRDVNAAINIAYRPLAKRTKGSNCTAMAEVTVGSPQPEQLHYQT